MTHGDTLYVPMAVPDTGDQRHSTERTYLHAGQTRSIPPGVRGAS
jgi:hypothetical protein